MEYRESKNKLKTHEVDGFKVLDSNEALRFPTEATLKAAMTALEVLTENHVFRPCPAGQECPLCFLVKASAESPELNTLMERSFYHILGPLAHKSTDYHLFFSTAFYFFMLGHEIGKIPAKTASEVAVLTRMFALTEQPKKEL